MEEARQVREGADRAAAETLRLAELQAERIRRQAASQASAVAFALTRSAELDAQRRREVATNEALLICNRAHERVAACAASSNIVPRNPSCTYAESHSALCVGTVGDDCVRSSSSEVPPLFGTSESSSKVYGANATNCAPVQPPFSDLLPRCVRDPAAEAHGFVFRGTSANMSSLPSQTCPSEGLIRGLGSCASLGCGSTRPLPTCDASAPAVLNGGFNLGSSPAPNTNERKFRRARRR